MQYFAMKLLAFLILCVIAIIMLSVVFVNTGNRLNGDAYQRLSVTSVNSDSDVKGHCNCDNMTDGKSMLTVDVGTFHQVEANSDQLQQSARWLARRKDILGSSEPSKVFLFSYMRGGSSTAGQLFNQDKRTMMWYEPLDAFYMTYFGVTEQNFPQHDLYFSNMTRRISTAQDKKHLTDFLTNMMSCKLNDLPVEALVHPFLTFSNKSADYVNCMGTNIQKDYTLARCSRLLTPLCGTTVESSILRRCETIIDATRTVFRQNPQLVADMIRTVTADITALNVYSIKAGMILSKILKDKGQFSPVILQKLKWFILHQLCMGRQRTNIAQCIIKFTKDCTLSNTRVLQVNRMKMEDIDQLLERHPDMHVIHFIRDPRAIAVSRIQTDYVIWDMMNKRPSIEARIICSCMADDVRHVKYLSTKYPESFSQLKYEDLITDPQGSAIHVYARLGKSPPSEWEDFASRTMHASQDGGPWIYQLKDAVANLGKWRTEVSDAELEEMNQFCAPLLKELDYPL